MTDALELTLADAKAIAEYRLKGGQHPVEVLDWAFSIDLNGQRDHLLDFVE